MNHIYKNVSFIFVLPLCGRCNIWKYKGNSAMEIFINSKPLAAQNWNWNWHLKRCFCKLISQYKYLTDYFNPKSFSLSFKILSQLARPSFTLQSTSTWDPEMRDEIPIHDLNQKISKTHFRYVNMRCGCNFKHYLSIMTPRRLHCNVLRLIKTRRKQNYIV